MSFKVRDLAIAVLASTQAAPCSQSSDAPDTFRLWELQDGVRYELRTGPRYSDRSEHGVCRTSRQTE
jgi:hypothetical protein